MTFARVKKLSHDRHAKRRDDGHSVWDRVRPMHPGSPLPLTQSSPICPCDGDCPLCTGTIQPELIISKPDDMYDQAAGQSANQEIPIRTMPQPLPPFWGQRKPQVASSQGRIQWGRNAENFKTDRSVSAWRASSTPIRPQPVSWGTIANMSKSARESSIFKAIEPPIGVDYDVLRSKLPTLAWIFNLLGNTTTLGFAEFPSGYKAPNFEFNTWNAQMIVKRQGSSTMSFGVRGMLLPLQKGIQLPLQTGPPEWSLKRPGGPAEPEWYAYPLPTELAYEGDARAYYPKAGIAYQKNLIPSVVNQYVNFPPDISDLIRKGEQEHCNDYNHAYNISLFEAEYILQRYIYRRTFGPASTKAEVEQMVLDTFQSKLIHPQLGNDKTQWASKYPPLFEKSLERDHKGWHSFKILKTRRRVGDKAIYDFAVDTRTKISKVPSAQLIKY